MNINDRLLEGNITVAELVRSLQRFPAQATIKIEGNRILIQTKGADGLTYLSLDETLSQVGPRILPSNEQQVQQSLARMTPAKHSKINKLLDDLNDNK